MENRHFSGAILHYLSIFNRKSKTAVRNLRPAPIDPALPNRFIEILAGIQCTLVYDDLLPRFIIFNAKSIIFNAKSIIFNAKSIIFNAKSIVF